MKRMHSQGKDLTNCSEWKQSCARKLVFSLLGDWAWSGSGGQTLSTLLGLLGFWLPGSSHTGPHRKGILEKRRVKCFYDFKALGWSPEVGLMREFSLWTRCHLLFWCLVLLLPVEPQATHFIISLGPSTVRWGNAYPGNPSNGWSRRKTFCPTYAL